MTSSAASQALAWAWGLLAQATSATAPGPAEPTALPPAPKALYVVTILGIIAIIGLAFRVKTRPDVLDLRNTPRRPSKLGPVLVVCLLVVLIAPAAIAQAVLIPMFGLTARSAAQPENRIAALQAMLIAEAIAKMVLLGVALLVGWKAFRHGLVRGMGLGTRHWVYDTIAAVVAFFAVMPIVLGLLELTNFVLHILHVSYHEHPVLAALKELGDPWKVLAFVGAAVITPPAEELFFRGIVQTMFRQYLGRPWAAIAITSVFFALMHMETPNAIPSLVALAIVLGYLYERSGRLWAPIFLHAVFNAFNMGIVLSG